MRERNIPILLLVGLTPVFFMLPILALVPSGGLQTVLLITLAIVTTAFLSRLVKKSQGDLDLDIYDDEVGTSAKIMLQQLITWVSEKTTQPITVVIAGGEHPHLKHVDTAWGNTIAVIEPNAQGALRNFGIKSYRVSTFSRSGFLRLKVALARDHNFSPFSRFLGHFLAIVSRYPEIRKWNS